MIPIILRLDPNNVDAYLMLAENESNLKKSHDLLVKAVKIGERELGQIILKKIQDISGD